MRQSRERKQKAEVSKDEKLFCITGFCLPFLVGFELDSKDEREWWEKKKHAIMKFWQSDLNDSEWFDDPIYQGYGIRTAAERKKTPLEYIERYGI